MVPRAAHYIKRCVSNPRWLYEFIIKNMFRGRMEVELSQVVPPSYYKKYKQEIENSVLHNTLIQLKGRGAVPPNECINLYILLRYLKPLILVETGVANGFSTAYILKAVEQNGDGKLFSIDIKSSTPEGKEIGWVVPEELRDNWELIYGASYEMLQPLLDNLGEIDFFMHDSEHSYECMDFELRLALKYLSPGGVLTSHDSGRSGAFYDIVDENDGTVILLGRHFTAAAVDWE